MSDSTFLWGTVTAISPALRVQLDGDTAAVPATPSSLVALTSLAIGDRVRCELASNRLIVHGRYGGAPQRDYVGTVAVDWTAGKPNVTLSDGTVVSAHVGAGDVDVQPGSTVVVERIPGTDTWVILRAYASGPAFPKQVDLRSALLNNWKWYHDASTPNIDPTDNSKSYAVPRVTRTNVGWVQMQGLIRSGTATAGTVLLNLPAKFRPLWNVRGLMCLTNGGVARIDVLVNGDVVLMNAPTNTYLDLGGVHFINDPALTWNALTLSGTWASNASTNDPTPGWAQDATGRVHIRGIVKNTSTASGSVIASMPTAQRYTQDTYLLTPVWDGTTYGTRVDLASSGDVTSVNSGVARTNVFLNIAYLPGSAPMEYQPNLVNASQYGAGYSTRGFTKLSDSTVMLKAMLVPSATGAGQVFTTIPAGLRSASTLITASMASNGRGRTDILANGIVRFQEGTASWLSLDNITYVAEQ